VETRKIGSLNVSIVGLGCNNFGGRLDAERSAEVVAAALEAGITMFDTADIYGGTRSEEYLGRALKMRRVDVVIATKFGMAVDDQRRGAKPEYVRRAAEDSLRRLGTDYIDLYQLHQPDPSVPIGDTLGALNQLVQAGKVREIGCSNFSVEQLREAHATAPPDAARFVSIQNEFSLLHREAERDILPECKRLEIGFIPFFPLASGLLTGKFRKGEPPPQGTRLSEGGRYQRWLSAENLRVVESLIAFATAEGHTLLELAISWLASHTVVSSVIAGATRPDQVRANAKAAEWRLTDEERAAVESIVSRAS
jgi:aryl-alcohol dehydrogenase-like predicted oxidoreductase